MGIFATKTRKTSAVPDNGAELRDEVRAQLPRRFEAVGESLASGRGSREACDVAGRQLAQDGASLEEALEGLRSTALAVIGRDPSYDDIRALSIAWSESTLAYLHQISCEDPLTGLASLAHARSRISELYREQARTGREVRLSHALVLADLPADNPTFQLADLNDFSRTLRVTKLGESARTVFSGTETIGRLGSNRILVLVERDERLGRRVALLRTLLSSVPHPTRVWIEGLPADDAGAALLLDELARP